MGSCLGTPVNNHSSSPITTKPSTAEASRNNSNRNGSDYKVFNEDGSIPRGGGDGETTIPNLKMFTLTELKSATRNFRPNTVLGEGGFVRVFKGWIDETTLLPTKVGTGILSPFKNPARIVVKATRSGRLR